MDAIVIERMNGGPRLVIEDPGTLAFEFFSTDASSVGPDAYDQRAGRGEPNRITTDDVRAINRTMRARSRHSAWEPLTAAVDELPWLAAIPPDWDLIATNDEVWRTAGGADRVAGAIEASVGPIAACQWRPKCCT